MFVFHRLPYLRSRYFRKVFIPSLQITSEMQLKLHILWFQVCKLRYLVIKYNMENTFWALSKTLEALLCRCGRFFHVHANSNSTKISVFSYKNQHNMNRHGFWDDMYVKKRPHRQIKALRVLESAQNAFFILYLITKHLSLPWTTPILAQSWS